MEDKITTARAAEILGVTRVRIRQLLADGILHGSKWGRDWQLDHDEVHALKLPGRGWPNGKKRKKKRNTH